MADDDKQSSTSTGQPSPASVSKPDLEPHNPPPSSTTSHHPPYNSPSPPSLSTSSFQQQGSRADLLDRARSFLTSPQIRHEDVHAKRRFLADKGLTTVEIETLMGKLPLQIPLIPPRTYPQPAPSNLPNLLLGLFRAFTWIAGGSTALFLVYYRFLLPRLTHSFRARNSLKSHQKVLLSRLTDSLTALKTAQSESFPSLPQPSQDREDPRYADCHTIDGVATARGKDGGRVPEVTLLRCALEEHVKEGKSTGTEELFKFLQSKLTWVTPEEWPEYQNNLWQTLSTHPHFTHTPTDFTLLWSHAPPAPPLPSPLIASLSALHAVLPGARLANPFQHTLQALSDFTGYITTQTYALPHVGVGRWSTLSPQEEEMRREIRALKGLVLNRRSFMPHNRSPGHIGVQG